MTLLRFDPFRHVESWTDQVWRPTPALAFDAVRRDHEVVLHFDLPGVDPSSIGLTVERNALTVSAERQAQEKEGDEVIVRERRNGRFSRRLVLGDGLNKDAVTADYDAGVLTVTIALAETVLPRRIAINGIEPAATDGNGDEAKVKVLNN